VSRRESGDGGERLVAEGSCGGDGLRSSLADTEELHEREVASLVSS
jgi:hypothetical protein